MFEESASAIPSIWESMNSWFTPTVLFVLLNVVIGTIAFTSTIANQNQQQKESQNDPQQQNIARSPSVLQRLKSINFFRSQDAHQKKVTDSDTLLFNPESSHEAQNFEEHSRYFFQPSHRESFHENLETTQAQTHYVFQQDLHETQDRLIFEEEKMTHLDFQEDHEQKAEKNELQSLADVYSDTGSHFIRTKSDTETASSEIPVKLPARMIKSASLKSAFRYFEEDIVEARRPATARENGNSKLPEDHEVDAKADDFINKFKHQLKLQRLDSANQV